MGSTCRPEFRARARWAGPGRGRTRVRERAALGPHTAPRRCAVRCAAARPPPRQHLMARRVLRTAEQAATSPRPAAIATRARAKYTLAIAPPISPLLRKRQGRGLRHQAGGQGRHRCVSKGRSGRALGNGRRGAKVAVAYPLRASAHDVIARNGRKTACSVPVSTAFCYPARRELHLGVNNTSSKRFVKKIRNRHETAAVSVTPCAAECRTQFSLPLIWTGTTD